MFRFGFSEEQRNDCEKPSEGTEQSLQWLESNELYPAKNLWDRLINVPKHKFETKEHTLYFVSAKDSVKLLNEDGIHFLELAEEMHSDLLPAKYEGGLKVWECTYSLIEYLIRESIEFSGKKVLDLGCGAGLLGVYSLLKGGLVSFQDYNSEVIEAVTFPNVFVNLPGITVAEIDEKCRFFTGDWASFVELHMKEIRTEEDKYDFILSSETIYNTHNHKKLIFVLRNLLKKTGISYVAAKTYYFGVGGSIRQFEKELENRGDLKSTICWKSLDGVKQEILKVEFKNV